MQKNIFLYIHPICIICLFSQCITIKSIRHWPKEDCAVVYSSMCTKCVPPKSTGGPPIFHPVMILMAIPYIVVDTLILPVSIPFALGKEIYYFPYRDLTDMLKFKFLYPLHWAVYKGDLNQLR
jgi:hypothetical protein